MGLEELKPTTRDGILFGAGTLFGYVGINKIRYYLDMKAQDSAKYAAQLVAKELQSSAQVDPEKVYKALDDLTTRISELEKKLVS